MSLDNLFKKQPTTDREFDSSGKPVEKPEPEKTDTKKQEKKDKN
jgi:hypothetical protein